jgi:hypothetical protein
MGQGRQMQIFASTKQTKDAATVPTLPDYNEVLFTLTHIVYRSNAEAWFDNPL